MSCGGDDWGDDTKAEFLGLAVRFYLGIHVPAGKYQDSTAPVQFP